MPFLKSAFLLFLILISFSFAGCHDNIEFPTFDVKEIRIRFNTQARQDSIILTNQDSIKTLINEYLNKNSEGQIVKFLPEYSLTIQYTFGQSVNIRCRNLILATDRSDKAFEMKQPLDAFFGSGK